VLEIYSLHKTHQIVKFSCALEIKWKARYHICISKTFMLYSEYGPCCSKPQICCISHEKQLSFPTQDMFLARFIWCQH